MTAVPSTQSRSWLGCDSERTPPFYGVTHDPSCDPLGRLSVTKSIHSVEKRVKGTKTEQPREVPVHPHLAAILADWRSFHGWPLLFGGLPSRRTISCAIADRKAAIREPHAQEVPRRILDRLGLRRRRQHDARRTLVTLARTDGARTDILKWVVHGPGRSVVDLYTSPPWVTLCEAISCLRIAKPAGEVVELRQVAGATAYSDAGETHSESTTSFAASEGGQRRSPASCAACGARSGGV